MKTIWQICITSLVHSPQKESENADIQLLGCYTRNGHEVHNAILNRT